MGITTATNQVTWDTGSGNTHSVAADALVDTADDYTFSATCTQATIQIHVDNAGTPADGDTLDIYASLKGDPNYDNAGVPDDYDTIGNFLTTLDTYATTGGTDPAIKSMSFYPIAGQIYQFSAVNNGASAMTVGIRITEMKVA